MANLSHSQAEWTQFAGKEIGTLLLAPARLLDFVRKVFALEDEWVANLNDATSATPHFTTCDLSGVSYGVNTSIEGYLYVRIAANAGNWDVKLFKATGGGGSDEVARATNVAAGATGTLVAQNSSGLTGTVKLGATIAGETNDRHRLYVIQAFKSRLRNVLTGGDEADAVNQSILASTYDDIATRLESAIGAIEAAAALYFFSSAKARGATFLGKRDTALLTDTGKRDADGNVTRIRTGALERMSSAMRDETNGGEQDIVKLIPAAGSVSYGSTNTGSGVLTVGTPTERCPPVRVVLTCVQGVDDDALGREEFAVDILFTEAGNARSQRADQNLRVGCAWAGPFGLSGTLVRTLTKTGDGSNLHLAAMSNFSSVGENNENTDEGVLYWQVDGSAGAWIYSFYNSSTYSAASLVAQSATVAAGATFQATAQNGSGLVINGKAGSAPVDNTQGTLDLNGFYSDNGEEPDSMEFSVTVPAGGEYQRLIRDVFGAELNSDTSGSESIPDTYAKQGTYVDVLPIS